MMATRSPKKSTTTKATIHNTVLNTPKVRMIPENNATNVLHRASFSMSPVEQKKLKPATPPEILAMRDTIAENESKTFKILAHCRWTAISFTTTHTRSRDYRIFSIETPSCPPTAEAECSHRRSDYPKGNKQTSISIILLGSDGSRRT
ncbi:uncharacterized protein LOC115924971 isoform X2 [Strongylocentrotus purpuratus]|uniref:Uncharacterized protein n=1 Tax=Strongylocentrotus purpuratus TaxID=7668 RepID=A0A7M7NZE0_STRPU|nr:uncharacterized protein LOC115924971 isoform X2 [Strongylocentrotus purpuratus]